MSKQGICYLVGAGPGDPGLMTVKACDCIRKADIIYYDHLAAHACLDEAPAHAERVYVGKKAGDHAMPQQEIQDLICQAVKAGKVVVRLKGGDPYVFGRGGEEALQLQAQGLAFEIVPGITAGIAGAAYAGIPVTHRNVSTAITLVTGHENPQKDESQINWEGLARGCQTLCFYMGVSNLPRICEKLMACGRAEDEPVAVIQWGTTTRQRTVIGTLKDIAAQVKEQKIRPPALTIVGPVVNLRDNLRWFDTRPLCNRKIMVTRSRSQASELSRLLLAKGAQAIELPTIEVKPMAAKFPQSLPELLNKDRAAATKLLDDCDELSRACARLHLEKGCDWAIFTSVNGVEHTWQRLDQLGLDTRVFGGVRVAVVGSATADALRAKGIYADLVPERFVAESLLEALRDKLGRSLSKQRFLLLQGNLARHTLREALSEAGAAVDSVTAYQTIPVDDCPQELRDELLTGEINAVTFASSSTAENFASMLQGSLDKIMGLDQRPRFVSIGPVTSASMKRLGIPVDKEAQAHTIAGLVKAVEEILYTQTQE